VLRGRHPDKAAVPSRVHCIDPPDRPDDANRTFGYVAGVSLEEAQSAGVAPTAEDPWSLEPLIENRTFDEMEVGNSAGLRRRLTRRDIELFAVVSGDVNPAHVDKEYASTDMFHEIVAHGMWGASLISAVLGTRLPGPGAIYIEQTLRFRRPITIGDLVTVTVTVASKDPKRHRLALDCRCVNQGGETVIEGVATVLAPTEKVRRPRFTLPEVSLREPGTSFWFG
jgi:acyl dehydratase